MRLLHFLIPVIFTWSHCFGHISQESLEETLIFYVLNENKTKVFESLLPSEARDFQGLNFNIKWVTSKPSDTLTPDGWSPDWGTEIFISMQFEQLTFEDCNFKWLNFSNSHFKNVTFVRCNFEGTVFDEGSFQDVTFENCDLRDASFYKSQLDHVLFSENDAPYVNFINAGFDHVSFISNHLEGSNFFGATAISSNFEGENENVLFYDVANALNVTSNINKPVILISWNNKAPGPGASKIMKKIQEFGGIPFKFYYQDSNFEPDLLDKEIELILHNIKKDNEVSLPKKIFDLSKNGEFPEITKIQQNVRLWTHVVSGVVFPGGSDIHPFFYGQEPHSKTASSKDLIRELMEFAILDEVDTYSIPFLGICRGSQMCNIWRGGTLFQHVEGHFKQIQTYHLNETIDETQNGVIIDIFRNHSGPFKGYSSHHQAVDQVGKGLKVVAKAEDGIVKALEMTDDRFGVLIQWHPEVKQSFSSPEEVERDSQLSSGNLEIFKRFIEAASLSR